MHRSVAGTWALAALTCAAASVGCAAGPGNAEQQGERRLSYDSAPVPTVDVSYGTGTITDEEVDCWWRQGIRHVVVATNNPRIARQQLETAVRGGMTVDVYVYLYWHRDMAEQVREARAVASDFPVGILWLDVEHDPGSRAAWQVVDEIERAVDACGGFRCGIYTRGTWWDPYTDRSESFADMPLWYARYGTGSDLSSWSSEAFGGWERPWGKQWAENRYVCGVSVDRSTMRMSTSPAHPRTGPEEPAAGAPRRPTGLDPDGGDVVSLERSVRLLCNSSPGATQYELEVDHWNGREWRDYVTFETVEASKRFSPVLDDRAYRWRARAGNDEGWSPWSAWARFDYGTARSTPPDEPDEPADAGVPDPDEPDEPADAGSSEPAPQDGGTASGGIPSNLTPDGTFLTSSPVTLTFDAEGGATLYQVEIERRDGSGWLDYYTYEPGVPSKTFSPVVHDTEYRWRARARVAGAWGLWSGWASFYFD